MSWGFIITRYIQTPAHVKLCWQCVQSIRRFYSTIPIVILDDHSPALDPHSYDDQVHIVTTFRPGAGEFAAFYYFWKARPFARAVYLHDSTTFQKTWNFFLDSPPIRALWSFAYPQTQWCRPTNTCIGAMLSNLNYGGLLQQLYTQRQWQGCFGGMVAMEHEFVDWCFRKYALARLIDVPWSKAHRMAWERILGLIIYRELGPLPSSFGDIMTHPGAFTRRVFPEHKALVLVKTWHGR